MQTVVHQSPSNPAEDQKRQNPIACHVAFSCDGTGPEGMKRTDLLWLDKESVWSVMRHVDNFWVGSNMRATAYRRKELNVDVGLQTGCLL